MKISDLIKFSTNISTIENLVTVIFYIVTVSNIMVELANQKINVNMLQGGYG